MAMALFSCRAPTNLTPRPSSVTAKTAVSSLMSPNTVRIPRAWMSSARTWNTGAIRLSFMSIPFSGADADDRVPVGRVLVGIRDPHEERIVEKAPHELHADREPRRRLAHGEGERRVAGVVEGLGVAAAASARRQEVVLHGLEVAAR